MLRLVAAGLSNRQIAETLEDLGAHRQVPRHRHLQQARRRQPRAGGGARRRARPALGVGRAERRSLYAQDVGRPVASLISTLSVSDRSPPVPTHEATTRCDPTIAIMTTTSRNGRTRRRRASRSPAAHRVWASRWSANSSRRGARVAFVARTRGHVEAVARAHPGAYGIVGDVARKEDIYPIALQIPATLAVSTCSSTTRPASDRRRLRCWPTPSVRISSWRWPPTCSARSA